MNHSDHVHLLEGEAGLRERLGLPLRSIGGTWADLGAGSGAFTLALADLLGPGAPESPTRITAVDRDRSALSVLARDMQRAFPAVRLETRAADFTQPLELAPLDGIVMANALHFIPHGKQPALLRQLRERLKPGGQFLMIEYNADQGNPWVPYPFSYSRWEALARAAGYAQTTKLAAHPSRFLGEIYAAVSV